jgi:hypothetical protein
LFGALPHFGHVSLRDLRGLRRVSSPS